MIGLDLLYRGVPVPKAEEYLGSPADRWLTCTIGEVYERLRARGWDVAPTLEVDLLIAAMKEDKLPRIPGWTAPTEELVHEVPATLAAEVPLIEFRCARKGHTWKARGVYRWETATDPKLQSEPLCPYCFIEFANTVFAVTAAP